MPSGVLVFCSLVQFKLEKKKVMLDGHTNKPLVKVEGEEENKNIRRKARQFWILYTNVLYTCYHKSFFLFMEILRWNKLRLKKFSFSHIHTHIITK